MRKSNIEHAKSAAAAQSTLFVMGAVVALLEGGTVVGGREGADRTAQRIIRLANRESGRQLRRMDKHLAAIEEST